MARFSQDSGSFYNENSIGNETYGVLKKGWKCKKCLEQATACLGHDRGFLVATELFPTGLGHDKASWIYVATWFSLCRDMVRGFKL